MALYLHIICIICTLQIYAYTTSHYIFFNVKNKSGCAGYCCIAFYLVVASRGCSLVAVHELLIVVTSTVVEHRLQGMQASVIMALGSRA